ncbi:anti-sigma factor family protein [Leadbettera azotonutricia]|uniref:Putative zinc-finger domain-containing protein n=1 Tax=Leadbettera azotonutricia (strain ATCC BAA-888 / DSM 13862 / ZAS-9) TaxID=545695 RepID=F5YA62_LEAAZ|nr:zf-HC2 domain-containing protein [Leadbettera azotonutricia]AEF82255.1 conserved hypothetical protein [Leadbettera azotonutricia ZAS-9]
MCPDRQILSLYADGELPSPWKEKMEVHLLSCEDCQSQMRNYQAVRSALVSSPEDGLNAAQERVWAKISGLPAAGSTRPVVWRRRISLPLPAAAAAAAAFVLAAFLAAMGARSPQAVLNQDTVAVSDIGGDLHDIAPMTDMDGILQYLSSQDTSEYMIIRLPETTNFSSYGEPALLRAADYSKQSSAIPRSSASR